MSKHSYEGEALKVRYDAAKCIHVGECVRGNSAVFDPENRPWVQPDAASADEVAKIIERCPTGALTYERLDGGAAEAPTSENTVRLSADGPVYLEGELEITLTDGTVETLARAALCRCGASQNKPFCDGRHAKADFQDPGLVGNCKTKDAEEGATALKARVLENGPVLLEGPYRLLDGQGEARLEAGSGALCRCGASQNKPFCDGRHSKIGFEG